ncbi:hypothetical protein Q5P01_018016 [Channa striata]|uniref:Poly [ADP-ribose] polymerase n=1 Tax=Channa striata TaxID=64152 RepID=A0AA88M406_CHASR|nr:hypothetical protein Q5P01_018016 [Channa striata]
MSFPKRMKLRTFAVLFCIITFTTLLFTYTFRDPSFYFFKHAFRLPDNFFTKGLCACRHCITDLEDDLWFAEHFNQSIHPLMTRENSILSDETFKWWQWLQSERQPANFNEVVEELFQVVPDKVLYMDASPKRCRTCAVVGNSGNLKGSNYGKLIDSNEFIIRMNQAPTAGFENDVGSRTTHHIMYPESAIDLDNNTRLVLIPFKILDLQWIISALTKATIKYTYVPVMSRIKANKDKVVIYSPTFFKYVYESWLDGHGRYPSTGFLSLMLAIHICDEVSVFGFGSDKYGNWHHYWEENLLGGAFRQTGVHDGDYEYNITLALADKHKIQMFNGRLNQASTCHGMSTKKIQRNREVDGPRLRANVSLPDTMPVENPEERTVEVLSLPETVDEELLSLYFENKRSGGGPLVSVEKRGDRAILVFEDAKAAAKVLSKGNHILHNVELIVRKAAPKDRCRLLLRGVNPKTIDDMVELYVENMLGLDATDYTLYPSPARDVILIHLTHPFSKDFQSLSARISGRALDGAKVTLEQIEQPDSILVKNLHPGTTSDLLNLYFESTRGGNQRVKDVTMLSEDSAKVTFVSYESVDTVLGLQHKLENVELVVKPYFDFLQPKEPVTSHNFLTESQDNTEQNPEAVCQMETSPSTVDTANPQSSSQTAPEPLAACEAVEETAEEVMEDQSVDTDTLSSHIPITDPLKLALFQLSPLSQNIEKTHPDLTVQIKCDGVQIEGTDRQKFEQMKQTILDFVNNMAETRFTLEPERAQLLARKDVKERLQLILSQTGSPTIYSVSDCKVVVTSLSQNSANQACNILKSQLCNFSIPVDVEYEGMFYCKEWTEFLQALGFTSVKMCEHSRNIDVVTLKGMEIEKQTAIMEFLTTPIERETVISMEPGMLKYIQIHRHQLLADMDQVSILPLEEEDMCGLKIHGHAVACQMAEEVLQDVVSSICTRTITVNAPGVARFLEDTECKSILNEMESKFQVYISTKHVPWEPLPHQDIFVTAWEIMSHQNFQKISTDEELKSDSFPSAQNGASNKGLLEEAKRIMSAIDERLEESASSSDQVDNMDNFDLYTAEEPTSLADQDFDAVTAKDSLLSAGSNTTSALSLLNDGSRGLSSSLEEEAQLSLAIQYSMEQSGWSLEDEEEQLKKALELSKKMVRGTEKSLPLDQPERTIKVSLQDAIKAANTIQLVVFAGYSCDLIRVDIAFGKKVSQRQVEEKLEHRCVKNMSEYHRKCLEMIKRKHAVEIQVEGTIITVSGFKDFVTGGVWDVKLLLEKITNSVSDQEILTTVKWLQHDPGSSDTVPYSPEATVFMENAWRMKLNKVDISLDNQPHIISFEKMEEYNIASGKSVKISRKLIDSVDLGEGMAEEEYSLLSNLPEASKVDEESDEFQNVVKNFYETIQEYHSKIRIIQVEKLMNRLLYNQYKLKKASVLQRATYPQVERTLYHGTSEKSVKEICIHGFNRSFCGKNATLYGQGVYFAVNSALSVQEQYSPPNADGHKFIFVSKVLTGDFTKGCHSMKTAPLKETGDIPLRYDSVTDNITKPSMFVIFNDTQAFPEYLITCQRIHR